MALIDDPASASDREDEDESCVKGMQGFPNAGVLEFSESEGLTSSQLKLQKQMKKKAKSGGFETLGLSLPIYKAVKRKGYKVPTPIQRKTLPLILAGYDVVAMARTGSGKTAAFLVPMIEKLRAHSPKGGSRAVILSPSRELALQTFKFCKELGRYTDLRVALLVGGESMEAQFEELSKNPDVIISTPGRLMHHLSEVEGMSLRNVEYVVFDEADRLFEMGFAEQLRQILTHLSDNRQTLLFSATLPSILADFAKAGLRDPHVIRLDIETKISPDLQVAFFTLRQEEKIAALVYLLKEVIPLEQQTIIFVSTKHHVEFLSELLRSEGFDLSIVYGEMDQTARKIHIAKFRSRKTMILLVTDVAARGIDIPLLDNVINYDFPPKPKLFVHRVGRAARAGRTGTAYSFLTSEELPFALDLHLFLSKPFLSAPTEEQIVASGGKALQDMLEASSSGSTVYGRFPQNVLDSEMDRLRESIEQNTDLSALAKTCNNGFRLFIKSRPAPSVESCKRAKTLRTEGLHLLFRQKVGSLETAATAFVERLKSFRPKQTVLEAEAEAAKAKNKKAPIAQVVEVMKRKREVHGRIIDNMHHEKQDTLQTSQITGQGKEEEAASELPPPKKWKTRAPGSGLKMPCSFRDEEFYINAVPSNRHSELGLSVDNGGGFGRSRLDTEVLDLIPDENSGVQKLKSTYHWDKKHKKFVKLQKGEKVSASGKVKTESGARVNAGNRGIYKKWKERSHLQVNALGEEHDGDEKEMQTNGKNPYYQKHVGRKQKQHIPNAHVRNELKQVDEVRKSRQQKLLRQAKQGSKGKGKKNKDSPKGRKSNAGNGRQGGKMKGFKKR